MLLCFPPEPLVSRITTKSSVGRLVNQSVFSRNKQVRSSSLKLETNSKSPSSPLKSNTQDIQNTQFAQSLKSPNCQHSNISLIKMSQYVDPYEVPKSSAPPPSYPGTGQQPVVIVQEGNVNVEVSMVTVKEPSTIYVGEVRNDHSDDSFSFGCCCGCCAALMCCTVM